MGLLFDEALVKMATGDLHIIAALFVVTLSFCGKFGTYLYNERNKGTFFAIQSNCSCTIVNLRKNMRFT